MAKTAADAWCAAVAAFADALAAFAAVFFAVYLRFESGWFRLYFDRPENIYEGLWKLGIAAAVLAYFSLRHLRLYRRPQRGTFHSHVPRLLRGALTTMVALLVGLSLFRNFYNASAGAILLFFFTFSLLLLLERATLFQIEILLSRHATATNCVLFIGADSTAARLARCFSRDTRLRVKVSGFLLAGPDEKADDSIGKENLLGYATEFHDVLARTPNVSQVIVTQPPANTHLMYAIASECERHLIRFNVVPDMFRMLTQRVEVETIDDVPLMGLRRSPLDSAGNRFAKRTEDILGALVGLLIAAPIIFVLSFRIRRESPGPVFFGQTRTGYGNKPFTIWKLRSMKVDAEAQTGAVWAVEDDPRRTKIGAFMREHNLDELPQFWNVLRGDMSLVGPRPERPEFVEQFTDEIEHYMRRHVCRPGITGWAQVHGLRGNTSITDRLHADLWYLENWSLALDLKILLRTVFSVRNAY